MSEVPPPVPPGEGDANHGKQDASRLDRLSQTPIPARIRHLDKQMNRHLEANIVANLVPNTKEGNIKAWTLTGEHQWSKRQSVTEHSIFTSVKKSAEKAEKIRNEGNS